MRTISGAARRCLAELLADKARRFEIEAARRFGGDDPLRVAVQLARQDDFLLIAAGERAGGPASRPRALIE